MRQIFCCILLLVLFFFSINEANIQTIPAIKYFLFILIESWHFPNLESSPAQEFNYCLAHDCHKPTLHLATHSVTVRTCLGRKRNAITDHLSVKNCFKSEKELLFSKDFWKYFKTNLIVWNCLVWGLFNSWLSTVGHEELTKICIAMRLSWSYADCRYIDTLLLWSPRKVNHLTAKQTYSG